MREEQYNVDHVTTYGFFKISDLATERKIKTDFQQTHEKKTKKNTKKQTKFTDIRKNFDTKQKKIMSLQNIKKNQVFHLENYYL